MSAVAVDELRPGGRRADLDRELVGQGAANALPGLVGGLPVTGAIVRSSTNVAAGAVSRASAVLHRVWVLVFPLLPAGAVSRASAVLHGVWVLVFSLLPAGAVSRASAVLHGVWVLVFSLLPAGAIERIPAAVLAGLLVVVGAGLLQPGDVRTARQHGPQPTGCLLR